MNTRWLHDTIRYDGSQLRSHWLHRFCGLAGDAMAAFRGPCAVAADEMADLEDLDGPGIAGDDLVHFVWESFAHPDLLLAVHRQRLLAAQAAEVLRAMAPGHRIDRHGDDLHVGGGKLSISVATATPVSSLIHFAVNATPGGAPVATATLQELGVEPQAFALALLQRAQAEQMGIAAARAKVRAKGAWQP